MIVFKWLAIVVLIQSLIFFLYLLYILFKENKETKRIKEWEY